MADFPSSPAPVYPISETAIKPEVLVSVFRDGSEQRRMKGAGPKRVFKLKFGGAMPITETEKAAIDAHYSGQNGNLTSFSWTHPDRGEVITVRYAAPPDWTNDGYNFYNGTIQFQEVPA